LARVTGCLHHQSQYLAEGHFVVFGRVCLRMMCRLVVLLSGKHRPIARNLKKTKHSFKVEDSSESYIHIELEFMMYFEFIASEQ